MLLCFLNIDIEYSVHLFLSFRCLFSRIKFPGIIKHTKKGVSKDYMAGITPKNYLVDKNSTIKANVNKYVVNSDEEGLEYATMSYDAMRENHILILVEVEQDNLKFVQLTTNRGRDYLPENLQKINSKYIAEINEHINPITGKGGYISFGIIQDVCLKKNVIIEEYFEIFKYPLENQIALQNIVEKIEDTHLGLTLVNEN